MFLSHFNSKENDKYSHLELSQEEQLLKKLPSYYRQCYLLDTDIQRKMNALEKRAEEILSVYLPDPGKTMSGEFAEILSYQLILDQHSDFPLFGPKKWLWKTDRNEPMKKTDVIFFGKKNSSNPSDDDLVIASEIKSKATAGDFNPIQDGVDGSKDDYIKRLAITLSWLQEHYIKTDETKSLQEIERFIEAVKPRYGPYKKIFKTIAVIDSELIQDEMDRDIDLSVKLLKKDWKILKKDCESIGAVYNPETKKLSFEGVKKEDMEKLESVNYETISELFNLYNLNIGHQFDITVVAIKNLKEVYENTYNSILTSYKGEKNE